MPSLNFVLPHWAYWSGLLLFPVAAMVMVARQRRSGADGRPTLFVAYLFWFWAGIVGLHRFYLRSPLGLAFVAVFAAILWCNGEIRDAREDVSRTRAAAAQAHTTLDRARAAQSAPDAAQRRAQAEADSGRADREFAAAQAELDHRHDLARWAAILLGVMLLGDAFLIPRLVARGRLRAGPAPAAAAAMPDVAEIGTGADPTLAVHTRLTDAIDSLSVRVGEFVAYWAVLAVFAYYYEVVARYVFNSPTNWVHESMFLMFGIQYMLSGALAYREDQHVRVDILYAKLSVRGRAVADIVTSVFFFIFAGTMLWTGMRFALDAIEVGEHSFTEWGVQYWPVKLAIPVGAALILLQGLSKLIKDVVILTRREA